MTIFRAVAGLFLGIVVFAGLLYFIVVVNLSQRLEDPKVYRLAIDENDAYNRVYDEVLVDEALQDQARNLMGGVDIEVQEEAVEVLKDVMPPAYLREQTEQNIERFTGFLIGDRKELNFYVELKEPLSRVKPAVLKRINKVIDEVEIKESGLPGCSLVSLQRLAVDSAEPFAKLSDGKMPESAPSLNILTRECREQEFDSWFDRVLNDPAMNSEAARILEREKEDLRQSFVDGDTRAFLQQAAAPLVTPLIDDAIRDIRRNLQRNDRLDLLEELAENSEDISREDISEQAVSLRDTVSAANGIGRVVTLVMVIVGSLLLAAVHFPRPGDMLRWPGVALLMGGGVCLIVGFVVNSSVPGRIKDAIVRPTSYSSEIPTAAISIAGDLVESFARQVTAGFIPAAVTVMLIGGALVVASLFSGALWTLVRRLLPVSDGDGRR